MYKYLGLGEDTAAAQAAASYTNGSVSLKGAVDKYKNNQDQSTPGGIAAKGVIDLAEAGGDSAKTDKALEGIVTAACAASATAACAATGALAAVAPLCGMVGASIGPAVYKGIKAFVGLFRSSKKQKAELARLKQKAEDNAKWASIDDASAQFIQMREATLAAIIYQYAQLFPDNPDLTVQQAQELLKSAGLPLVWDVGHYQNGNADGKCIADSWNFPDIQTPILTGNPNDATRVSRACGPAHPAGFDISKAQLGKSNQLIDALIDWHNKTEEAAKIVMASLINAVGSAEVQSLVNQTSTLLRANASLANDSKALSDQLLRQQQYKDYYLKIKREAADKRLASEQQKIQSYINQADAVQRTERLLIMTAGGILLGSMAAAIYWSRKVK